jgi:hypothetical protein
MLKSEKTEILLEGYTEDDTWVSTQDPGTKRQSSQYTMSALSTSEKVRQVSSNTERTLVIFPNCVGNDKEFIPPGQTVNQHYYREFLQSLY